MLLSIIIITYNSNLFINKCIESIFKNIHIDNNNYEIIIFDNNSNEKLVLRNNLKNINLIQNSNNLGFSKAVNYCSNISSGKYILVLNPDVVIKNDIFTVFINYLNKNNNTKIMGAKVLDFNNKYQKYSMRRFPSILNTLVYILKFDKIGFTNFYNYEDYNIDQINSVSAISGCCMMYTNEIFNLASGFNEKFFLFFEETDFCKRIRDMGYKVIYHPKALVMHHKGSSMATISNITKTYYFISSMIYFFFIHIKEYKLFLINCILSIMFLFIFFILN